MPVNAKTAAGGNGGDFVRQEAMDEGTYPTRIVQAINYGLQEQQPYKGAAKEPRVEVGYTYEFLDEFCVDEEGNEEEDRPRWVSETFPVHNIKADKAKSTKRLVALDPDDDLDGDFLKVVNFLCNLTITKTPAKTNKGTKESPHPEDKYYNNVAGVSPMREKDLKRYGGVELVNEPLVFDVDEPDEAAFKRMPKWQQDKCKANLEYRGSALEEMVDNMEEDDDSDDAPKKKSAAKKKPVQEEEEDKPVTRKKSRRPVDDEPDGDDVSW